MSTVHASQPTNVDAIVSMLPANVRISQMAEACQVSTRTVHRWIAAKKLHAVRFGVRGVRIPRAEVARFFAEAAVA